MKATKSIFLCFDRLVQRREDITQRTYLDMKRLIFSLALPEKCRAAYGAHCKTYLSSLFAVDHVRQRAKHDDSAIIKNAIVQKFL